MRRIALPPENGAMPGVRSCAASLILENPTMRLFDLTGATVLALAVECKT